MLTRTGSSTREARKHANRKLEGISSHGSMQPGVMTMQGCLPILGIVHGQFTGQSPLSNQNLCADDPNLLGLAGSVV
jgi:hypothetical protein